MRGPNLLFIDLSGGRAYKYINMPEEGQTHPAKNEKKAKVEYNAEFALEPVFASTWPPPPNPVSALNMPGHMKQTKPSMEIWKSGW